MSAVLNASLMPFCYLQKSKKIVQYLVNKPKYTYGCFMLCEGFAFKNYLEMQKMEDGKF